MIQDVIAELQTAGFRIAGVVGGVVVGERPVAGEPHTFRVCSAWPEHGGWYARLVVTRPNPNRVLARMVEEQVAHAGPFHEGLDFGIWLGGQLGKPVSAREVAALVESPKHQVSV